MPSTQSSALKQLLADLKDVAPRVVGEWAVSASILQCDNAVNGRICLTETGELVYLADGVELVGRGVGRWVAEGPVVGFEVDIFQYAPTSTKHTQGDAHRFRGVAPVPGLQSPWVGEWYFCAFNAPPRQVGSFSALRRRGGSSGQSQGDLAELGAAASSAKRPSVNNMPEEAKKIVIAKLDKLSEPSAMLAPRWLKHLVSGLPEIHYVSNWFEPVQAEAFRRMVDQTSTFESMKTRSTTEYGSSIRCPCGKSLLREELPEWLSPIITALHELGLFHPVLFPANSVRINSYVPGQGIWPHMDGPMYFPKAVIISLGSPCIMDFHKDIAEGDPRFQWDQVNEVPKSANQLPEGAKPALSLILEPGSLLSFAADAFTSYRHGIEALEEDVVGPQVWNAKQVGYKAGSKVQRTQRVSLTVRHLLQRCNCSM